MDYRRLAMPWRYKKFDRRNIIVAASVAVLLVSLVLIIYFSISIARVNRTAPHEWFITREMWRARPANSILSRPEEFQPLRLVIIHHTVSRSCHDYRSCVRSVQSLQSFFLRHLNYDIGFNFLIGNDGWVYEGRGLGVVGAHMFGYNSCSIGIGFVGDYQIGDPSFSEVTPLQVQNTLRLLNATVLQGYLHEDYHVVGARDLSSTISPGDNLYNEIQTWPTFDHNDLFHFIVGNDGRVYEGRLQGVLGAHTIGYNSCSIGISFIGNYHQEGVSYYAEPTPLQVQRTLLVLNATVLRGYLHEDYHVVGARDVTNTISPGDNLYSEIQTWPTFDHNGLFVNKNCSEIHAMFENSSTK